MCVRGGGERRGVFPPFSRLLPSPSRCRHARHCTGKGRHQALVNACSCLSRVCVCASQYTQAWQAGRHASCKMFLSHHSLPLFSPCLSPSMCVPKCVQVCRCGDVREGEEREERSDHTHNAPSLSEYFCLFSFSSLCRQCVAEMGREGRREGRVMVFMGGRGWERLGDGRAPQIPPASPPPTPFPYSSLPPFFPMSLPWKRESAHRPPKKQSFYICLVI